MNVRRTHSIESVPAGRSSTPSACVGGARGTKSRGAAWRTDGAALRSAEHGSGRQQTRNGVVAVIALIGLLVAGMIATSLVRLAVTRHRQLEHQALRLQSEWLAESGLERAAARLSADAGYAGETWDLSEDSIGGNHGGRVVITIQRDDNDESRVHVTAVADYPVDMAERARTRRTVLVERDAQRGAVR